MPSPENADAVLQALRRFGAPLHNLTKEDLLKDGTIFQIGVAPRRIDIITAASGLRFEPTYRNSIPVNIEGIEVSAIPVTTAGPKGLPGTCRGNFNC